MKRCSVIRKSLKRIIDVSKEEEKVLSLKNQF